MTVRELEKILFERGLRHKAVSFEGGVLAAAEQYIIEKTARTWEVYYYERGNKNNLRLFSDESSACLYLLALLERDRTVWSKATRS
jgi:hypothetical protein